MTLSLRVPPQQERDSYCTLAANARIICFAAPRASSSSIAVASRFPWVCCPRWRPCRISPLLA